MDYDRYHTAICRTLGAFGQRHEAEVREIFGVMWERFESLVINMEHSDWSPEQWRQYLERFGCAWVDRAKWDVDSKRVVKVASKEISHKRCKYGAS